MLSRSRTNPIWLAHYLIFLFRCYPNPRVRRRRRVRAFPYSGAYGSGAQGRDDAGCKRNVRPLAGQVKAKILAGWGLGLSFDSAANADTIPAPRFDIIWRDPSGNYWDMVSSDGGQSVSCCGAWGHPNGFPFSSKPSIAALGDGRLIVGGLANTAGGHGFSYQQVWDTSHLTGWMLTNGAFVGGLAIAAY